MKQRLVSLSILVLTAGLWLAAAGCATSTGGRHDSDLPWNEPQPWEGSPFIPGMDRY